MNKKLPVMILLIIAAICGKSQQIVQGTVITKTNGEPLAGASLKVTRTSATAVSDADGNFSIIALPGTDTLSVTYVGYQLAVLPLGPALTGRMVIELAIQGTQLKEVELVSTGYQQLPKERATGSFDYVSNEEFNQQVGTTVLSRLEPLVSGLSVDRATTSSRIQIRGLSTLGSQRDVLIVVDNFPYEGSLDNLNPNDVDNITVLKDAAAASIWGVRAGNGVIVITTKKGRYNQPLQLSFNSNATFTGAPDLGYIKQMDASDYIDVEQFLYGKGYYTSQINATDKGALTPVVEILLKKTSGALSAADADAQINALRNKDVRTDFYKYVYGEGVNQQYALSLNGGTGNHSWILSTGYDKNKSNLDAAYDRVSLKAQNQVKLGRRLQLGGFVNYTLGKTVNGKPSYSDIRFKNANIYPYASFADAEGNPVALVQNQRLSYLETVNSKLLDWKYYPLTDYKNSRSANDLSDAVLNAFMNYTVVKGVTASFQYQYERQQSSGEDFYNINSYIARNLINTYTQIPAADPIYKVPLGGLQDLSEAVTRAQQGRLQLSADRIWGDHAFSGILGGEVRQRLTSSIATRNYGYNETNGNVTNVDYTTAYPSFITKITSFIPNYNTVFGTTNRYVSAYGNAAYTYRTRYTLSGSARRDASNLFGATTNNKWKPLWSAGVAWTIANEAFYKVKFLPDLKLRATYGYSGNIDPNGSSYTTLVNAGTSPYTNLAFSRFNNYANPELRWETSGQLNLGVDFSTRGQRISGSLDVYRKISKDLLSNEPVDITTGILSPLQKNAAKIEGKGFDLVLNSINLTGNFKWNSSLNFSRYKDKIINYYLASTQGSGFLASGSARVGGLEGLPVYSMFSYKSAGLDPATGQPRGYDKAGQPSTNYTTLVGATTSINDLVYHGPATPVYFGSFSNSIGWKNFTASAAIVFKLGYYFRRETLNYASLLASGTGHSDYAQRWQKAGDEATTNIPSLVYPLAANVTNFYQYTEPFVERGDHARVQYVNLGYTLPSRLMNKLPMKKIQVYANAANLGIIWRKNKAGIDPDYRNAFTLPAVRTVSFGLRAGL